MSTDQEVTWAPGHGPEDPEKTAGSEGSQQDYFGFAKTQKWHFPDKVSWIEFRAMAEGEKKNFQDDTSSDMVLERRSGDARMSVKQGTQRHELIKACVVDWNMVRGDKQVPFSKLQLNDWLTLTDPLLVEDLEREIRKVNPWLLAEMSSKDIKREIENLQEMLKVAEDRERGEAS